MVNNELYHYGRKGMKWYQNIFTVGKKARVNRRRQEALKKARETKQRNREAAIKRQKDLESGRLPVKKMTDAELEAKIRRLNLEKQYKELNSGRDSVALKKGKRFADKFSDSLIDKIADPVAADLIAQAMKHYGVKAVNKAIGEEATFTNNKRK